MDTPGPGNGNSELETTTEETVTEAVFCSRLGLSQSSCWLARKKGLLPHYRYGRRVMYGWPKHAKIFLSRIEKNVVEKGAGRKQRAA